ncbi:MAG: S9 family peptidase [Gammaproteobacteria bacterium]
MLHRFGLSHRSRQNSAKPELRIAAYAGACGSAAAISIAIMFTSVHAADAAEPAVVPVEDLFRSPAVKSVKLSPDGKYVTAIVRQDNSGGGADNLIIVPTDGSAAPRALTRFDLREDVSLQLWATPETLLYETVRGRDEPRGRQSRGGLFAIDRLGSNSRRITDLSNFRIAQVPAQRNGKVLLWLYSGGSLFPDAGWLNVGQNRLSRVIDSEPGVIAWFADHQQRIRASVVAGERASPSTLALRYRRQTDDEWRIAFPFRQGLSDFQGFDQDGEHLWIITQDKGRLALFRLDPETGDTGPAAASDPVYDIDGVLLQDARGRALEVSYDAELPSRVVFDPEWQEHYAQLNRLLPETFNSILGWSDDEAILLVRASGDRHAGSYYLYRPGEQRLDFLVAAAPWLHQDQLAPMQPVSFAARDGLTLHGYYTAPVGHKGGPAPMILLPHGGPFGVRNSWGFDSQVQFLASRGYAVLQVNFRGSSGYGVAFELAGYGQWGMAMQDDLSDAVAWAIDTGRADPAQVCIYGASYGGYAALMGLIKSPELYRCGISYAGVTDRKLLYRNDRLRFDEGGESNADVLYGNPEADPALFDATSPVNHVDRIRAPVLVAHGQVDGQVDIRHFRLLTRQLKKHDKQFDSFERRFEGHGLIKEANRIAFYQSLEDFLARYMPTPRNPAPGDATSGP